MSIGIALAGRDGIILASDSRKVFLDGKYNDNAEKILELTGKVGVIGVGGHAGYQDWLVQKFGSQLYRAGEGILAGVKKVDVQGLCFEDVVDWFVRTIRSDFDYVTSKTSAYLLSNPAHQLIFIVAGYNSKGSPCIVSLDSSDVVYPFCPDVISCPRVAVAGIDFIWNYWTRQLGRESFKIEELSIKSLKLLVAFVINETAKANNLVGGNPQIAVIQQGKDMKKLGKQEIEELQKEVADLIDIGGLTAIFRRKSRK